MLAYIPVLRGPFVFDDVNVIANDSKITTFPPLLAWLNPASRPLVGLTFALNYLVGGMNPWGFHLANVVLHIGCGWLIAELARLVLQTRLLIASSEQETPLHEQDIIRLKDNRAKSRVQKQSPVSLTEPFALGVNACVVLLTAFWLLHPISSSAVAYIVQRSEILAACSIVGFQIAIIRDAAASHRRWQSIAAAIFVAGMYCKVNTVSALPIALLLDRLLLSRSWQDVFRQRGILYLVPVVLGITAFVVMLPSLRRGDAGVGFAEEIPTVAIYLATQSRVLWHYFALCVWPGDLCIDYRWPPMASVSDAIPWAIVSLGLLGGGVWLYWHGRLLGWLVLSVFLLLAPTSSFIPVTDIALDHRMYLATAAVIAGLMIVARWIMGRWRWSTDSWVTWAIACLILVAMLVRTSVRANDWSSGFDLWRSAARVVPHNPRALQNLTSAADQEGRRAELLIVLETLRSQGMTRGKQAPAVASRLAEELMKSGQQIGVEPLLAEAIDGLNPAGPIDERQEHAAARVNFGLLLLQRGDTVAAEEQLQLGLRSDPKQAFAHAILGDLAYQRGDFQLAIHHFKQALEIIPDWDQASRDLAKAEAAATQKPTIP